MSAAATAQKLFGSLKAAKQAAITAVPSLEHFGSDLWNEGARLVTQGSMEFASALFSGHAFVPYGPGQYTPSHDHVPQQDETRTAEHERAGIER
ncbi:MAG TPA: hypothetical protein VGN17_28490 [Bryobacteraceae bacterium]|jgi:hypothetical protein